MVARFMMTSLELRIDSTLAVLVRNGRFVALDAYPRKPRLPLGAPTSSPYEQ
jgi:hypothetical protein